VDGNDCALFLMSYINFPTSVLTDRSLVNRQPSEVQVVVVIFPVVVEVAVVIVRTKN